MKLSSDTFIHERALVQTDHIGEGTRIWAFAHVMRGVVVGAPATSGTTSSSNLTSHSRTM